MTKETIRNYILNTGLLLMLWSGIPFFIGLAGITAWIINIFVMIIVPLIIIAVSLMDGNQIGEKEAEIIRKMKESFKEKQILLRGIGWGFVFAISYSLYVQGWVIIGYTWFIFSFILTFVVSPMLRKQLEHLLEIYEERQNENS